MNPSSAPGESPVTVRGMVTSAAATGAGAGAGGLPTTSISKALISRGLVLLTQQELEKEREREI